MLNIYSGNKTNKRLVLSQVKSQLTNTSIRLRSYQIGLVFDINVHTTIDTNLWPYVPNEHYYIPS
jgi:hypothetical protein